MNKNRTLAQAAYNMAPVLPSYAIHIPHPNRVGPESLSCLNQKSLLQRIFSLICHLKEKVEEMVQKNFISECPKEPFERDNASLNGGILHLFWRIMRWLNIQVWEHILSIWNKFMSCKCSLFLISLQSLTVVLIPIW